MVTSLAFVSLPEMLVGEPRDHIVLVLRTTETCEKKKAQVIDVLWTIAGVKHPIDKRCYFCYEYTSIGTSLQGLHV